MNNLPQNVLDLVDTDYKTAKETFVLNTENPSLAECLFIICMCLPYYFLYNMTFDFCLKRKIPIADLSWKSILNNFILDTLYINCVNIVSQTWMKSHYLLLILAVFISLLFAEFLRRNPISPEVHEQAESCELFQSHGMNEKQKPYLTVYRGITMTLTVLAIMAVDFTIFPRRLAKTFNWGYSLMDMGVGLFVCNSGMVSRQLRYKGGWRAIKASISSVSPLLVLGTCRFLYVYLFGYQHVVSEYGYHWNFFFTLALVAIFSAICAGFMVNRFIVFLSLCACLGCYQYWLLHGGTEYLLNDVRTTFFDQNKEGIMSCFGYFSIYLGGLLLGYELLKERNSKEWKQHIIKQFFVSALLLGASYACEHYIQPSSRRMANATYVLYTLFVSCLYSDLILLIHYHIPIIHVPLLYQGINNNQLFIFLLANVMTGIVNMSIKTLITPPYMAYLILLLYVALLKYPSHRYTTIITIVSYFLLIRNIRIKFW